MFAALERVRPGTVVTRTLPKATLGTNTLPAYWSHYPLRQDESDMETQNGPHKQQAHAPTDCNMNPLWCTDLHADTLRNS
jgi:hypothetical protein